MFGNNPYGRVEFEALEELHHFVQGKMTNSDENTPATNRFSLWQMIKRWRRATVISREPSTVTNNDVCAVEC